MRILIIKDPCGEPYMIRFTLAERFGRELKLHFMLLSDNDRELHDHPWGFWSLVLAGGYDEHCADGSVIVRNPGALDYRAPEWRHRVVLRPLSRSESFNYKPWPMRLLLLLDRLSFFRKLPLWPDALTAIGTQWLNNVSMSCTLVLTTRRSRTWGFWRKGQFIPHDQFTSDIEC